MDESYNNPCQKCGKKLYKYTDFVSDAFMDGVDVTLNNNNKKKDLLALNGFHSTSPHFILYGLMSEVLPFPNWHSKISNHSYCAVPLVSCVAKAQQTLFFF